VDTDEDILSCRMWSPLSVSLSRGGIELFSRIGERILFNYGATRFIDSHVKFASLDVSIIIIIIISR